MNIRRVVAYLIPGVVILLFLIIMQSPSLFKGQKVSEEIDKLKLNVEGENWTSAPKSLSSLDMEWRKVIKRIQFGAERDEISHLNQSIA